MNMSYQQACTIPAVLYHAIWYWYNADRLVPCWQTDTMPTDWYHVERLVQCPQTGTMPTYRYNSHIVVPCPQTGTMPTDWYHADRLVPCRQTGTMPTDWYHAHTLVSCQQTGICRQTTNMAWCSDHQVSYQRGCQPARMARVLLSRMLQPSIIWTCSHEGCVDSSFYV